MKRPLLLLFVIVFVSNNLFAQLNGQFSVNWGIKGMALQPNIYTLNANQTYTIDGLSTNFCATSTFRWTVSPSTGYTISSTTIEEPTIRFTSPGSYSVSLQVNTYGAQGWTCGTDVKIVTKTISIPYTKPVAAISPSASIVNAGSTIKFTDASTNNPMSWQWSISPASGWSFSSGSSSSQSPTILFGTAGSYTVSLRATNPAGNTTASTPVTINAIAPVAAFNGNNSPASQVVVAPSGTVSFKDLSTNAPTSWQWTITPASGWSYSSGSSTSANPQVRFTGTGLYTVALRATNSGGSNTATKSNYINVSPAAPVVTTPVNYCQNATPAALTATGTALKWYTVATGGSGSSTAPLVSTSTTGTKTYYVSQTLNGLESPRAVISVVVSAPPSAPGVTSALTYCVGTSAGRLTASGTNLKWYTTATGGTGSATAPVPATASAGSTSYYVTQTNTGGCESTRARITVTVSSFTPKPDVVSPLFFCVGSPTVALTAGGAGLKWYTASTGGTGSATAPVPSTAVSKTTIYYVSQTVAGCGESARAEIIINVGATPAPAAPVVTSPVVYQQNATATPLTATGSRLKWYTTATGGTALPGAPTPVTASAGTVNYYVAQTNDITCEGPRAQISVVVLENESGRAPDWAWAKTTTGASTNNGVSNLGIAYTDADGNSYMTGNYSNTVTFEGTTLTNDEGQYSSGVVVKYNKDGEALWVRKFGGSNSNLLGTGIVADKDGNYFITGSFMGTTRIGAFTLTSTSYADIFVAKFTADGQVVWAVKTGDVSFSENSDRPTDITLDNAGNIVVVGQVETQQSAGGGSYYILDNVYIVKFNSAGVKIVQNYFRDDVTRNFGNTANSVSADGYGNTFVTGNSQNRFFLAKYDAAGLRVWMMKPTSGYSTGTGVTTDAEGNSYVVGSFTGTLTLANYTITSVNNSNDIFIAKYNTGGQLVWLQSAGGTERDDSGSITLGSDGSLYITGHFKYNIQLGNIFFENNNSGLADLLVAKYNAEGNVIWAKRAGSHYPEAGGSIGLDKLNNIYLTASYYKEVSLGNLNLTGVTNSGQNSFLARLGNTGIENPVPDMPVVASPLIYRQGETAPALTAEGRSLKWYTTPTGGTALTDAPVPSTTAAGEKIYYVTQTNTGGIESPRATLVVRVLPALKPGNPPEFVWAKTATTTADYQPRNSATATDAAGNTYAAGYFTYNATFGGITLTPPDTYSANYLVKYDPQGTVLWARTLDYTVSAIAIDSSGNYYLAGSFNKVIKIGTIQLTPRGQNGSSSIDMLLAKYAQDGTPVWATSDGDIDDDRLNALAIDKDGNIFVTGYYTTRRSAGGSSWYLLDNVYIARFTPQGGRFWYQYFREGTSTNNGGYKGYSIAVDDYGNSYVCGTHLAGSQMFVTKYDLRGYRIWLKEGSAGTDGYKLTIDNYGNTYVTGTFRTTATFGDASLTGLGESDVFIAKYGAAGNVIWARSAGGEASESVGAVASDNDGNIYLTGVFRNSINFGSIQLSNIQGGVGDIFVAKYDTYGTPIWAKRAGETGSDQGTALTRDFEGNLYLAGYFSGNIALDTIGLQGTIRENFFVAKLGAEKLVEQSVLAFAADSTVSKTYGAADFALNVNSNNTISPITLTSSNTAIVSIVNNKLRIKRAGTVTITANQAAADGFEAAQPVTKQVTIKRAALTIKANDASKTYSDNNPALTVTYTGFVNGEDADDLTTKPTVTTTATLTSNVGTYPITAKGAVSSNYTFTYTSGTLTVKAYPALTYGYPDFNPKPDVGGITYTSSNPVVATIVNGKIHLTGAGKTTITAKVGGITFTHEITVNKAVVTVTANNISKTYSDNNPPLTLSYSGFLPGDNAANSFTTVPKATTTAGITSQAGTYPITVGGGVSAKYDIRYVPGILTVRPFPAVTYGYPDFDPKPGTPGIVYASSNTSVASIVSGKIHIKGAGTTTITAIAGGMVFSQPLVVNKAPLTIRANNKSKTAGAANPVLDVTYTGFVYGENANNLTIKPKVTTTATTSSPGGSYPITASGAASNNYAITYVQGTLTVSGASGIINARTSSVTEQPVAAAPVVPTALTPNGDGRNDVLAIAGIENFGNNKFSIITSTGNMVYSATGYDNSVKVFDGHAAVTGRLQPAGTYFYLLEYDDNGETKTQSGYFVLKY